MSKSEFPNKEPVILIVDDQPDGFEVIGGILYNNGYQLSYANSGINALKRLEISRPDIILLDVMMPEMNGIEVCERIRANPDWNNIPIIIVTALTAKEDLARCIEAGADDFISKPVSAIELRARLRSMLRIKQQYDALKTSLQLRSDMANMIVHDLRNPLTNIVLACEMLERSDLPEKCQARVERIKIAQQQLRALTESLLMMAKLESGKMILHPEPVALNALITVSIADFETIATQKMIQIIPNLPDPELWIEADALLLRRILDNLLSNAIKYSPSKSQITVQVNPLDHSTTQIQVVDMGSGISNDLKQRLFEKFEIGPALENVSQLGLGLAFCRMAIEAHGGTISIKDNQPKGSIVSIEIANSLASAA